jgi:predicted dehydrogenase
MPSNTLRIGFVGAGGIVRDRHVSGLRNAQDVEFHGCGESQSRVLDPRRRGVRASSGSTTTGSSWSPTRRSTSSGIGAHPYMHRIVTEAALEAGKHVFTQARMALDYATPARMYEAARRHPNQTTMISPPPHFMPGDRVVRRMIAEGLRRRAAQRRRPVLQPGLPRRERARATGGSSGRSPATTPSTSA